MPKVLIYTGARVLLFFSVLAMLYPFAGISLGTILLSIVLSALLSFVLLGRMREKMVAAWLSRREERASRRSASDIAEDEDVDRIDRGIVKDEGRKKPGAES